MSVSKTVHFLEHPSATLEQKVNHADTKTKGLVDQASGQCRMYFSKYPAVDDIVLTKIFAVSETKADVKLPEYGNIEAMVMLSDMSRRNRHRSITKLARVGQVEVMQVMRVDPMKGFIDLSKARVSPDDVKQCTERYAKSSQVHGITKYIARQCDKTTEFVYKLFVWDLYQRFPHALDGFVKSLTDPSIFDRYHLDPVILKVVHSICKHRLTPKPIKVQADVEVTCFGPDGIDAIKTALLAGRTVIIVTRDAQSTQSTQCTQTVQIKIYLLAPPVYILTVTLTDPGTAIDVLQTAANQIQYAIAQFQGGSFTMKCPPRIIHKEEQHKYQDMMDKLDQENQQVDGDESESTVQ